MDPEIQEVPVRSGASEQPEVVVVDSSAGEEPITAAKPALKPNTAQRDDPLEHMEKALENACETLANFTEHVMNFTYESQDLIFKNTNEFVKDLQEIESLLPKITARIPIEVIQAIDKGRNPEHCTYQMLESCAEANNVARGKLQAMRAFRDALESSVEQTEPKANAKPDGDAKPPVEDTVMQQLPTDGIGVSAGNAATNGF